MSKLLTFGDAEYAAKRGQTKRGHFLTEMDRVVPWAELVARSARSARPARARRLDFAHGCRGLPR